MRLGRKENGCAGIHTITNLNHVLLFAFTTGIRANAADIFEIDLDFFQWLVERLLAMFHRRISGNQAELGEQLPDGARRTRESTTSRLQFSITR